MITTEEVTPFMAGDIGREREVEEVTEVRGLEVNDFADNVGEDVAE